MPRLEDLDAESKQFILNYQCSVGDRVPCVPLRKPLARARVALITSAGVHRRSDRPFDLAIAGGDPTYRVIPRDVAPAELTLSIISANWDRTGFALDVNVVFPLERLRELAAEGLVGEVADEHYAFMGSIFDIEPVIRQSAPEVATRLRAADVDAAVLVPV